MRAWLSRLHLGGGKDESGTKGSETSGGSKGGRGGDVANIVKAFESNRATATSYNSFKPLPEVVSSSPLPTQLPSRTIDHASHAPETPTPPYKDDQDRPTSPRRDSDSSSSRKTVTATAVASPSSDVQKKVAFISPSTTPTPAGIDRALSHDSTTAPMKTTLSRFQATHGKEPPRGSTSSSGASSSKTDLGSGKASVKATSTRTASPYLQKPEASSQSLRSATPYSNMSGTTSGSRILAAQSWSEVTEEDLVSNLGSRERTRQEVLFEIISSEERYVQELVKMKDTFIDPLLHPFSTSTVPPLSSTPNLEYDYYRSESPVESGDHLPPIAARFMSPSPATAPTDPSTIRKPYTPTPIIDGESMDTDEDDENDDHVGRGYTSPQAKRATTSEASKHNHPRSPYRATVTRNMGAKAVPFPTRSHHSLPPPPRTNPATASTHSLGRQSTINEREPRERNYSQGQASVTDRKHSTGTPPHKGVLRKFKKSEAGNVNLFGDHIAPHQLPEDLRICLEVIDSGVFDGHKRLCEALKKRYDDQFPLVRSLADVFVANADIFQGYAKYVLHLERALEQVDNALSSVATTKKPKNQDAAEWQKVCKVLQRLEENACEKGETGLAITLSKPFQRLLKYPLLFQNLLFHTDPSTFEYESTLQMVAEVETIVRSIEDEKIQKEERDKTRDVFARIEGLDKVGRLALPKPSRVLLEERQCPVANGSSTLKPASPPPAMNAKGIRGKSSFKRLSDVLGTSKKEFWFVVFNDVVLQCQKTGTTSLPLVAATNSRTNSLPELQGKAKYATTGRRNSHTRPRNLYKFVKIETWTIGDMNQPRAGVVSMDDVARSRTAMTTQQPRIVPLPDDDEDEDGGMDSDDSDRKSKMSFSYWGADKITVQKPVIKTRVGVTPRRGAHSASYGRESSANAKFGTRLVSNDASPVARPASRRTQATTPSRRDDYSKATVTRPEWNTSTRPPPLAVTPKRIRNTSQTSGATGAARTAATAAKTLSSPAPSEDSGVGLYRQMLAKDPSLNS